MDHKTPAPRAPLSHGTCIPTGYVNAHPQCQMLCLDSMQSKEILGPLLHQLSLEPTLLALLTPFIDPIVNHDMLVFLVLFVNWNTPLEWTYYRSFSPLYTIGGHKKKKETTSTNITHRISYQAKLAGTQTFVCVFVLDIQGKY